MKVNKNYFIERLKEPSTYRGIFAFLGALGIFVSPEQAEYIIAICLAAMGTTGIVTKGK